MMAANARTAIGEPGLPAEIEKGKVEETADIARKSLRITPAWSSTAR